MKKAILLICGSFILLAFVYAGMKEALWPAEFMSLREVCRRFGERPLNEAKFKAAVDNRSARAQMACSLLKRQEKYKGKSAVQMNEIFGKPDGWFFNEAFSAYVINRAEKRGDDVWQILFLIDQKRKVSKIAVHKNCCY